MDAYFTETFYCHHSNIFVREYVILYIILKLKTIYVFCLVIRYGINVQDSHVWPCKTIYLYLHISKSTMFGLIKHFYINTASTLQLLNLNNEIKILKVYLYWTALFVVDCMICMLFSHRSCGPLYTCTGRKLNWTQFIYTRRYILASS